MKKFTTPLLLLFVVAAVGCSQQTPYYENYSDADLEFVESEEWVDYGNLDLLGGHVQGDIGNVRGLDQEARLRNGYGDETYASIEMHAENGDGAAMNLLEVWGGVDQLQPGTRTTYRPEDVTYEGDEPSVQVIGCAGPSAYDWSYDQPADEVEVVVSEGDEPDVLRLDYTARTFRTEPFSGLPTSQADVVTGSVDIRR
jgi:hypothetical protein